MGKMQVLFGKVYKITNFPLQLYYGLGVVCEIAIIFHNLLQLHFDSFEIKKVLVENESVILRKIA